MTSVSFPQFREDDGQLVYGMLEDVEWLAMGLQYWIGKVPTTLIFQTPHSGEAKLKVNLDKVWEICERDPVQTLEACRNIAIATDARAQMLVFEKTLKAELTPPPASGIRPETIFAVGRAVKYPTEYGFAVFRSQAGFGLTNCPNWREFDDYGNKRFACVLPAHPPTVAEQENARGYLECNGISIKKRYCVDPEKEKRHQRGRNLCRGM